MAIRRKELGVIPVDVGDVVCFPMDSVIDIMVKLGVCDDNKLMESEKKFIQEFKGVACEFGSDGCYGVDKVTVVDRDGETYDCVLVGGPENPKRFLDEDEPTFHEFMETRYPNEGYREGIFEKIEKEYARFLKNREIVKKRECGRQKPKKGVSDERAGSKTGR